MIISIFTPHLGILIRFSFSTFKRLWFSKNLNGLGSKINNLRSFLRVYVGPDLMIDTRYAQVN